MRAAMLSTLLLGSAVALSPTNVPSDDKKIQHLDAAGEFTYLGDLSPSFKSVGWGEFWVNRNWYEQGFSIGGHKYDNGVFAHAPSDVRYHIGGKYAFFSGCVGLDDGNVGNQGSQCGDGVIFRVFVDGSEKFTHHASGGEAAKCFRMSVKGGVDLQLIADHRTDRNCDESAWVNTKLYEDPIIDCMQLGDLVPSYKSVGYYNYFVNKNWYMQGFLINGVRYGSGVFAHANSKLVYPLHGKYHTFHGCAGVDDGNQDCGEGAHFEVRRDGLPVWNRQLVRMQTAQCFSVSVADAFALELRTTRGQTNNACDHTEWVNADLCITASTNEKVDCAVGDWVGGWSKCSKDCNTGYMSRKREIVTHPAHGGKHCPQIHEVTTCNTQPCPIDCVVGDWETATTCSVTCTATRINDGVTGDATQGTVVSGYQSRFRSIKVAAAYGGKACKPLTEKMACNTQRCPVDCKTSDYSGEGTPIEWSACTKSCGTGTQTRTLRVIQQPAHNGKTCPSLMKERVCNEEDCQIDCIAGAWDEWTDCSKDCNTGYKTRKRSITQSSAFGGISCGTTEQVLSCNTQACPIDCVVEEHKAWDEALHPCTRSCNGGTRTRGTSVKTPAAYGGKPCPSLQETVVCNSKPCPKDCQVSNWGTWSVCSKSCTGNAQDFGAKSRRRSVISPMANDGKVCEHLSESRECNKHACAIDCAMTDFGAWSECSLKCGGGTQSRSKSILRKGEYGGHECPGTDQVQPCNDAPCAVDCQLNPWGSFSTCSHKCGTGWQTRKRTVKSRARYGGIGCAAISESVPCNTNACPIPCKYSAWAPAHIELAPCDRSCGGGRRTQTRSIVQQADHGAAACGKTEYVGSCNDLACPLDCIVSEWAVWTDCSVSCGFGHQQRTRNELRKGQAGGKSCSASALFEERQCNAGPCSAQCEVSGWSGWSDCSKQCGTGVQSRSRSITKQPDVRIDQSTHDITPCPFLKETRQCSQVPCQADCVLNDFFDWSPCTKSCGTGWQRRHRTIKQVNVGGGKRCDALVEIQACHPEPCPVHCQMTPFSVWSPCSDACGGGTKTRHRTALKEGDYGGATCPHTTDTQNCNMQDCPQDCVVEQSWTVGSCSATCGGGIKVDTRQVTTPPAFGGAACASTARTTACNQKHCPLDCKLTAWSEWTQCTKTCGAAGTQTKTRTIDVHPRWNGKSCGPVVDTQECHMGPCPVHCSVSEWTEWTTCSKTCGTGTKTRERTVTQFSDFGGYQCPDLSESESCKTDACPRDCDVSNWGGWTTCSHECGGGYQSRTRDATNGGAADGGKECPTTSEDRKCNPGNCPIDCAFSAFGWNGIAGEWSSCSRTCGGGIRQQRRQISRAAAFGGKPCPSRTKVESCSKDPCPVDCSMSAWSWWSPCSKSCGKGSKTRSRTVHTRKSGSGKECLPTSETMDCKMDSCPVDCKQAAWGSWSTCSKFCGLGVHTRSRKTDIEAANGGVECGSTEETKNCKLMDCPVDCKVSAWGGFDNCNVGCGGGIQRHYRQVTVSPAHGGAQCPPLFEQKACNTQSCPVHCTVTDFADWSSCSRSCGTGIMIRKRNVHQEAQLGGSQCPELSQARSCNTKKCPVDCEVSAFTEWSKCSVTCGMGFKFRTRTMTRSASADGNNCPPLTETGFCNDMECPVACLVGSWGGWTRCSKTCGHGTKQRTRRIVRPMAHGGIPCPQVKAETPCFEETCPVDCEMGEWGGWNACSVNCGVGVNTNTRPILRKAGPKGKACGATTKTMECNMGICAKHCIVSAWSAWGECSKKCGGGTKKRTRSVLQDSNSAGRQCESLNDVLECNEHKCPQDCEVSNWSDWTPCDKDCGNGRNTRTRAITKPSRHGGKQCVALVDVRSCNTHHCAQDCVMGEWGSFTQCTKSCGGGLMTSRRPVLTTQGYGGAECPASPTGDADYKTQTRSCEGQDCPIDCKTTSWSGFTTCTKSCAEVIQDHIEHGDSSMQTRAWHSRSRDIKPDGEPKYGGKGCPHLFEKTVCNSYGECMAQFFSTTITKAPTAYTEEKWDKQIAKGTKHQDTTKADSKALETVRATNSPTPAPTEETITVPETCTNGAASVAHGWHGAGAGSNWCNLCRCNDGMLSCQKRKCGTDGLLQGETCSHTKCEATVFYAQGTGNNVVQHKVISVAHDHRENFGSLHHCSYMLNTQSCACHCYGNTFKDIIAAKASVAAALK